jgi:hypothetical protein
MPMPPPPIPPPRASAVEEAAISKPTKAASDRIFVMINLLRFPLFHCCVSLPAQLVGYRNDRNLGLVQIEPVENGPVSNSGVDNDDPSHR